MSEYKKIEYETIEKENKLKDFKEYEGREVIFITSYGSTNYGTRTEDSDNDYKIFVLPTISDLIKNKTISKSFKKNGDDYEVKDIRLLINLMRKSNPTYLEFMSAKENYVNPKFNKFWKWIQKNKYLIATCNLKGYFNAITGTALQKLKAIEKDLPREETNEGYKRRTKFGFDTKQLLHVERLMMMREEVFMFGRNPLGCIDLTQKFSKHSNLNRLKDRLIDIKLNKNGMTKEEALKRGKYLIDSLKWEDIKEHEFNEDMGYSYDVNEEIINDFEKQIESVIIQSVRNE